MSGSKKYSMNLPEDIAVDKLREIVADFETDNDELTRDEIEAARALLRHDHS
ncbi:hypothetical protein [Streptomyces capitiformicae]|uniref:Uncharacterized protein n=1 Tax=Streptomyces capitiformicae TaxID=2014920 RepID=A0A919L340_9ACTN|nr:hypothetical protein [Streptomyces capitiformicae]GHH82168.1 hypothetical protein GCM10017771_05640 [Streptomyces capitiformicae]